MKRGEHTKKDGGGDWWLDILTLDEGENIIKNEIEIFSLRRLCCCPPKQ